MKAQLFEPATVVYGDKRVRAAEVVCGKCGHRERVPSRESVGERGREDEIVARKLRGTGWHIGKTAKDHRCQVCVEECTPLSASRLVRDTPAAEPPRTPSPDDKQIIFEKLRDVYAGGRAGYSGDWTDKRVAEDLGVPWAWVSEVREFAFGPERSNPVIDEQLAQARAVVEQHKDRLAQLEALKAEGAKLAASIHKVWEEYAPATAAVERMERRLIEIEKAVR